MPLPANDAQWLPWHYTNPYYQAFQLQQLHMAWYSGDVNRIALCYRLALDNPLFPECRFWARLSAAERMSHVHVPLASEIAKVSASMLFLNRPKIKVAGAHEKGAPKEAVAAQEFAERLIADGFWRKCHEGAELASAGGGVVGKVCWDPDLSDLPILTFIQADNIIPEFQYGILRRCTLWKALATNGLEVMRWLEVHEPGVIYSGLYVGSSTSLGKQVPLFENPETKDLLPEETVDYPGLMVEYVPNILPNRSNAGLGIGSSDYCGSETDLDSLDEIYSKLQQEIQLAQARAHGSENMLKKDAATGNLKWNPDQAFYVTLGGGVTDPSLGLDKQLVVTQPQIRSQQYIEAAKELICRIVSGAGYSPGTFGDISGVAESGTALRTKQLRSIQTTAQKAEYWSPAIGRLFAKAQWAYAKKLSGKITPQPASVEMRDSVPADLGQVATTVKSFRDAKVMSIEDGIRMRNPDASEAEIEEEAARIRDEEGINVPDPTQLGQDGGAA
jgi:hypothetical protein